MKWIKIIAAIIATFYVSWQTMALAAGYVSGASLEPDEYSTGFCAILYCVATVFLVNYLIVCLLRLLDRVIVTGGMLEMEIHKHAIFLFSRKRVQINLAEIRSFSVEAFIPFGGKLTLILSDGRRCKYSLASTGIGWEILKDVLLQGGVAQYCDTQSDKKMSKNKETILGLLVTFAFCIFGAFIIFIHSKFYCNALMPGDLFVPIGIIGMFLGVFLRDLLSVGHIFGVSTGLIVGSLLYAAALMFNYYGADKASEVVMEYDIVKCNSVYHPASGTGRRRRSAHTDYFFTICSRKTGREVKKYSTNSKIYHKAKRSESVTVPVRRGALGYPIVDIDEMVFKKKENKFPHRSDWRERIRMRRKS